MWKWIAGSLATALLFGCAAPPPSIAERAALAGPKPDKDAAEAVVKNRLKEYLKDYDSLKDFSMREPFVIDWYRGVGTGAYDAGWLQCFDYNAKNSYGGYVGMTRDAVILRKTSDGAVIVYSANVDRPAARC